MAMFVPLGTIRLWDKTTKEDEKSGKLDDYNIRLENAIGGLMMAFIDFAKVASYVYLAVNYFNK